MHDTPHTIMILANENGPNIVRACWDGSIAKLHMSSILLYKFSVNAFLAMDYVTFLTIATNFYHIFTK